MHFFKYLGTQMTVVSSLYDHLHEGVKYKGSRSVFLEEILIFQMITSDEIQAESCLLQNQL